MMGRYAAHHVADLPPKTVALVRHLTDVLYGGAEFTEQEHAEALALVAQPVESPQRVLNLSPCPCDAKDARDRGVRRDDTG